jgi:hypothetical protein
MREAEARGSAVGALAARPNPVVSDATATAFASAAEAQARITGGLPDALSRKARCHRHPREPPVLRQRARDAMRSSIVCSEASSDGDSRRRWVRSSPLCAAAMWRGLWKEHSMVRLFVRHPVADYAAWRQVYDGFDEERQGMGVTGHAVFQSVDDPNDVTVWHDFETREQAESFAASDRLCRRWRRRASGASRASGSSPRPRRRCRTAPHESGSAPAENPRPRAFTSEQPALTAVRGPRSVRPARVVVLGGGFGGVCTALEARVGRLWHGLRSRPRIAGLYARLERLDAWPVVTINRAVAVGFAEGPAAVWRSATGSTPTRASTGTSRCARLRPSGGAAPATRPAATRRTRRRSRGITSGCSTGSTRRGAVNRHVD